MKIFLNEYFGFISKSCYPQSTDKYKMRLTIKYLTIKTKIKTFLESSLQGSSTRPEEKHETSQVIQMKTNQENVFNVVLAI